VPDDYVCPLCRHGKEDFALIKDEAAEKKPWKCPVCGYEHEDGEAPAVCPLCSYVRTGWKCTICGYVHAEDAPPEVCPLCSQGPEKFVRIGE